MSGSTDNNPRSFGISVGIACCLLAGVSVWRGRPALATAFGVVGLGLMVSALVAPWLLRMPALLWWRFARVLARINTRVLLSAFFFLVLTPVGVLLRLAGRDPLNRRWRSLPSGWVAYPAPLQDPRHFKRMY